MASCGEWCPDNDVAASISRATQMAKRALDSHVLTTIFSHEWYISPVSTANWQAILQGVTNNLASYDPIYVTLDYACQYVRATRTSRLVSSAFDPGSGQVTASFSGRTDLDTQVYVFAGEDSAITQRLAIVPVFSGSITSTVATLSAPPTILGAPASQTVSAGATVVFNVEATGMEPLSYLWYQNRTNRLSNKVEVAGATSNVLTLVNVLGANGGAYTVVVSNLVGVVTSTPPAILTVVDPVITAQPASRTNAVGSAAVFSVQAYGTAPEYQWYKNGEPVSGGTQAELLLAKLTSEDSGGYNVVVRNAYGSVSSSLATLTVWDLPVIVAGPTDVTNLAGTTAVLSVQAAGTEPLSYRWYRDTTNQLNRVTGLISSAGNVFALANVLGADGGAYTVVVSNPAGVVTSTPPAILTVIDPVITTQPSSQTNHAGSAVVFDVQAYGTAPAYQWCKNGEPVGGGRQSALVLAAVTDADAGAYSVMVSNAYGTVRSSPADLTVARALLIEQITVGPDGVVLGWNAVPGQNYLLEYKDNLEDTNWTSELPAVTAVASSVLTTNPFLNSAQRFYRAILLPTTAQEKMR